MRKSLAIMCMLVMGAWTGAYAQDSQTKKMKLDVWGGYATFNLNGVNNYIEQLASVTPGSKVTKIGQGVVLGVEALRHISPKVLVGPRIEYLRADTGQAAFRNGSLATIDSSLMPVLVGGRYLIKPLRDDDPQDLWELSTGLYAGYAWAWKKTALKSRTVDSSYMSQGGSFAAEALLGGALRVTADLQATLDVGYRVVPTNEMKATENNATLGSTKDATDTDLNGNTITHDFSGLFITLGRPASR